MGNESIDNLMPEEVAEETLVEESGNDVCEGQNKPKRKKINLRRETKRRIFYWAFMILPIAQMLMMYFYVNFSSFALAFTKYENIVGELGYVKSATFDNFKVAFEVLKKNSVFLSNSAINYVLNFITGMGLGTLFSFYVYKEYPLSNFFKIMLFLPSLISGVILALIFKYMVSAVYPYIVNEISGKTVQGLLENPATRLGTLLFYNVWVGFGTNVILMTGSMSGINDSLVEAAELDGITAIKEFWNITLPMIYPTLITFTITGMSGFFINDLSAYVIYGMEGKIDIKTFGYVFFVDTQKAKYVSTEGVLTFSEMAALGLIFSVITFTVMTIVKKLMEKFGPKTY